MHTARDGVRAFVEIYPQNRAPERLHGDPAALHVQIEVTAIGPTVDELLCRPGHVAAEVADVVLGEHRLQRALAGPPLIVRKDEQAVACDLPHFFVNDAPLGGRVGTAQHVTHTVGRHHRHDRRKQFLRSELDPGDGAAGVADHFLTGVEPAHQCHQLPERQRILRRQRQGADVAHECQSRTSPSPLVITVPAITRSRYGLSRIAANASDVGPSLHSGMMFGS